MQTFLCIIAADKYLQTREPEILPHLVFGRASAVSLQLILSDTVVSLDNIEYQTLIKVHCGCSTFYIK